MKKERTRREKLLAAVECVVPWVRLIAVIEPPYPMSGRVGRQPVGGVRGDPLVRRVRAEGPPPIS